MGCVRQEREEERERERKGEREREREGGREREREKRQLNSLRPLY